MVLSYCLPSLLGVGEEWKSILGADGLDMNCPLLMELGESSLCPVKVRSNYVMSKPRKPGTVNSPS